MCWALCSVRIHWFSANLHINLVGGRCNYSPIPQMRKLRLRVYGAYPRSNARDADSIPGSGRSPGEGHGNPLQYSCLENSMDRRSWWATVHGVTTGHTRGHTYPHTQGPTANIHSGERKKGLQWGSEEIRFVLKRREKVKLQGDKMEGSCKNWEGEGFSDGATVKRQGVNLSSGRIPHAQEPQLLSWNYWTLSSLELVLPKKGINCNEKPTCHS